MTKKKSNCSDRGSIIVEDIMTDEFETVSQDVTVGQLAHLMLRRRISGYPIVDDHQKVVGLVTFSDFFELIDQISINRSQEMHESIREISELPVTQIMSKNVVSLSAQDTLKDVIKIVTTKKVHTFPVIDKGKLIGMVGRHEVLNATFTYG